MASMSFDNNTVFAMMMLLDNNKDDVKESDYIKICNALKFLHNKLNNTIHSNQNQNTPRLNYLTQQIEYFDSVINNIGNGRVINIDKVKTLKSFLNDVRVPYRLDHPSYTIITNERVKELEDVVFNCPSINISRSTLQGMYKTTRNRRVEHEKNQYRNQRNEYIQERDAILNGTFYQ